jgi:hypothetical protein
MSDSEIIETDTAEIIKTDTTEIIETDTEGKGELRLYKESRQVLFKKQAEWYKLNSGKCLCDCVNCIDARKNKVLIF